MHLTNITNTFPDFLQSCAFACQFTLGDFVEVHRRRASSHPTLQGKEEGLEEDSDEEVPDESAGGLFSCPKAGCVKVYQRHSSLEKHLSYGKCKLAPERDTLVDKAKKLYHAKLVEGASAPPTIQGHTTAQESVPTLREGWALKSSKKSYRFSEAQKQYLEEKFNLGQETGHKLDPASVARDMRYARKEDGSRQFKMSEFLTAQQIQSFFSRRASKLRHRLPEGEQEDQSDDLEAAEEQQAYDNTRALVIREVQLVHPIVFDRYNLCSLYKAGKLRQLSVAMLRSACEYFDLNTEDIRTRRTWKAPYISLLEDFIAKCDCHSASLQ